MTEETPSLEKMFAEPRTSPKRHPLYNLIGGRLKQKLDGLERLMPEKLTPEEKAKYLNDILKYSEEAIEAFQKEDYARVQIVLKGIAVYFEVAGDRDYARLFLDLVDEMNRFCPP